jgi:hypothetical protein
MVEKTVSTIEEYIKFIRKYTAGWASDGFTRPWFRGQPSTEYNLLPSILRNNNYNKEFNLTTKFRLVAPGFVQTPETNRLDQWLFLMQHHGVPTRLLDWTESPLIALFFASIRASQKKEDIEDAAVYALEPMELNKQSNMDHFPNTWTPNRVLQTIKFAFGTATEKVYINNQLVTALENPTAIYPSTIHSRIKTQKSCFTLHGNDKRPMEQIFSNTELIKKKIPN